MAARHRQEADDGDRHARRDWFDPPPKWYEDARRGTSHRLAILDEEGTALDATIRLAYGDGALVCICESAGGASRGAPPRNPDYNEALETVIGRLGSIRAVLESATLESKPRMVGLRHADRLIALRNLPYPVTLEGIGARELRLALTYGVAPVGRRAGSRGTGNPQKRVALFCSLPRGSGPQLTEDLVEALSGTSADPTADPDRLDSRVRALRRRRSRAKQLGKPKGRQQPKRKSAASTVYEREPEVVAYVLDYADGNCEGCGLEAPFENRYGEPYLEVHHVLRLADNGPDLVENAVALCPNCHRRAHYAADAALFTEHLYRKTARLRRFDPRGQGDREGV